MNEANDINEIGRNNQTACSSPVLWGQYPGMA